MSGAGAVVLRGRGLSKRYSIASQAERTLFGALHGRLRRPAKRELWALRDVSVEIRRRESVGIIGLNGAGKTTLLSLLAGITEPTEGVVEAAESLRTPFLGLGAAVQPDLTVEDNIRLCAALMGLSRREIDERLERIIDFGELGPYRFADQSELSSGYQQRVTFSTALHADSNVLLIDESLSVGDVPFQGRCREAFERLRAEGKTIIVVSHDVSDIRRLCERCLYLKRGRLEADGDAHEVTQRFIDDCARPEVAA